MLKFNEFLLLIAPIGAKIFILFCKSTTITDITEETHQNPQQRMEEECCMTLQNIHNNNVSRWDLQNSILKRCPVVYLPKHVMGSYSSSLVTRI